LTSPRCPCASWKRSAIGTCNGVHTHDGAGRGPVRQRAEWLEVTRDRYAIEEFAFAELEVIEVGSVGVVRSRYRQRGSMDGEDRTQTFLMTDVWAELDGRPQLVTRHVSPLED
jgi:hypothetical protein